MRADLKVGEGGDKILPWESLGSQFDPYIMIWEPSPSLHFAPYDIIRLAWRMLLHANEPKEAFASNTDPFGKYFTLNTLLKREFVSWTSLQTCLANMASLNLHRSLKPIPPFNFDLHKISHFFQCILRLSPRYPHQNFRIIISISLQRPTGKRKQFMAKVGIAYATALMRTSFPACDSNFSFHPWIFPHTLSFIKFKLALLFCPTIAGRPKYFSYSFILGTPR